MYNDQQKDLGEQLPFMPEDELIKLDEILRIQSYSTNEKRMVVYLWNKLAKYNPEIDSIGNIIVTKGKAEYYPCIVSHMDTVHKICGTYAPVYYQNKNRVQVKANGDGKRVGVGGDDKCGIFACLYMLEHFDNIKVVFFTQEESGLIGSSDINIGEFDNVGYILQLDRWGRSDFINNYFTDPTVSLDFMAKANPVLKDYGYENEEGLITDSINLFNRNVGVSCVNISCGYYQHHSSMEFIDLNELWNSIKFTEALIEKLGKESYNKMPVPVKYYNKGYYNSLGSTYNSDYGSSYAKSGSLYKPIYDDDYWDAYDKKKLGGVKFDRYNSANIQNRDFIIDTVLDLEIDTYCPSPNDMANILDCLDFNGIVITYDELKEYLDWINEEFDPGDDAYKNADDHYNSYGA